MDLFFSALLVFAIGGLLAWIFSFNTKVAIILGLFSSLVGCCLGMIAGGIALFSRSPLQFTIAFWSLPYGGSLTWKIDPLSGFFLVVILGVCGIAACYGYGYWKKYAYEYNLGMAWFFLNLLIASMAAVVTAANAILFIVAWEIMSLSSFFLVTFENEKSSVRNAGITYLIATHIGTAFLFVMFWILGHQALGDMNFAKFENFAKLPELQLGPEIAGIVFIFALIGFGTKAGLMPFHVWLPEAHPAAPSHISAIMSGVMIKTGIYGILRILTFLTPSLWWGILLIALGVMSGVLGVIFAFAQKEIKKFLAYHSVENIGIICIGIGLGIIGLSLYQTTQTDLEQLKNQQDILRYSTNMSQALILMVLGFGGAIFHILNHAIFKSMMFMAAGAVIQQTETGNMNMMGGLLKKMPITGLVFLIGSVALSGLPPLNGFASEFFIYLASFHQIIHLQNNVQFADLVSIPLIIMLGLVLMGGMAMGYYVFSIIFLGEPRTDNTQFAKDPGKSMTTSMVILAALCFLSVGGIAWFGSYVLVPILNVIAPEHILQTTSTIQPGQLLADTVQKNCALVNQIILVMAIFAGIVIVLAILRWIMLRHRTVTQSVTWDCGFLAPTSKLQYTGSSFIQPLADLFSPLLHYRKHLDAPSGYFDTKSQFHSNTLDIFMHYIYERLFGFIAWALRKLDWMQHGHLHLYLLYIAGTLVLLLVWFILFVR